jgi:flavin-dependent dehydrogenase
MVYSAHASGIGMGLVAARTLADAVCGASDPGGLAATWAYSAAFHRHLGARLGGMDVLRRLFRSLSGAEADRLLGAGFLAPDSTRTGLALSEPVPSLIDAAWIVRAFVRAPALGAKVARAAVRIPGVMAMHKRYPTTPDRRALVPWAAATARLAGVEPDVR